MANKRTRAAVEAAENDVLAAEAQRALSSSACLSYAEPGSYDLRSILERLDDTRLDSMAHSHEGRKPPKSRPAIINFLYRQITDPEYIIELIPRFAPMLVKLFEKACDKADGLALDSPVLAEVLDQMFDPKQIAELDVLQLFGLGFIAAPRLPDPADECGSDESNALNLRLIVPHEVKAAYRAADTSLVMPKSRLIYANDIYARAAANLYGLISLEDFAEVIIQSMHLPSKDEVKQALSKDFFQDALSIHMVCQSTYFTASFKGRDYLVHLALCDEDDEDDCVPTADAYALAEMLDNQRGKKLYIPSRDELVEYSDLDHYEQTEQVKSLRRMISPLCAGFTRNGERYTPREQRESALLEIHQSILLGYGVEDCLRSLQEWRVKLEKLDGGLQALMGAIVDMSNNTRLWTNRGHTPMEMMKTMTGK